MNGQLCDHPLAELITEISAEGLSGALRLARERAKAVVHFDDGRLVAAHTNLRLYRLDESLKRWGAFPPTRLGALITKGMTDTQAGEALVAAGLASHGEVQKFQERRMEEALRPLLLWTDGEWVFDARARLEEKEMLPVDVSRLLLEASRRLPPEFVSTKLGNPEEPVSPDGAPAGALQLLPEEAFVLSRIDAPIRVGELLSISGLPEERTRQAVYALWLGGFLRRDERARSITIEMLRQAPAGGARPAKPAAGGARPRPGDAKRAAGAAEEAADPQAELDFLFLRAGGATHYEVLDVARDVSPADIKRAYYALAKRCHPDRFRQDTSDTLRARVEYAFSKITQAYEVLKDAPLRTSYDLKLEQAKQAAANPQGPKILAGAAPERGEAFAEKKVPTSAPPGASPQYRAEESFQQGLAALQQKNLVMATKYLGEAALLMPKQARYRALYGRALGFNRQTRRQAESELQTAIALEAENASFRVMLAELYQEIGLKRRAESELERALSIDPNNQAALRLLDTLRNAT